MDRRFQVSGWFSPPRKGNCGGPRVGRGDPSQERRDNEARTINLNRTPRSVSALRLIPSKARDPTAVRRRGNCVVSLQVTLMIG